MGNLIFSEVRSTIVTLVLGSNAHALGVGGKPFFFRQLDHIGGDLVQGRRIEFRHTSTSQKAVAAQACRPSAGAAGRQHVAWSCRVVS